MKEQIEEKIHEIIRYIISKPAEEISLDEYTVLANERIDIRSVETQKESERRMAELMVSAISPAGYKA